jgi:hypothetical protein
MAYNYPLIQKNGYTKEYVTPTSLAIYKIPQKSELHSLTQYDCCGVVQSQYPKYVATGSSSKSCVPTVKGTSSIRMWGFATSV